MTQRDNPILIALSIPWIHWLIAVLSLVGLLLLYGCTEANQPKQPVIYGWMHDRTL